MTVAREDDDSSESRRLLASIRLTQSIAIRWHLVSTAGFFAFAYLFGVVLELVSGDPLEPITIVAASSLEVLTGVALFVGLLMLVIVPHELLHGAVMARYDGRPAYGVGVSRFVLPFAYTRSEGTAYTRDEMLAVLLAPCAIITAVGLAALVVVRSPLVLVPLAANAAGSVGDLWMAGVLARYPSSVRVGELPDGAQGLGIYGSPSDRPPRRLPLEHTLSTFFYGASGTFVLVVLALAASVLASLATRSGDVVLGDPDGGWFLFRHELDPTGYGASFELGFPVLLGLSALGGLAWTAVAAFRSRVARTKP
ncbi:DUF3267 domain-containing protein [Natribaculum luteum]|uniref:DUF3267 domain-containing protein n=1 Tax=Natribaculum luteum TaxID=1586232 RepID=A0ABD5P3C5_9EURY|nr:DUF3267 domain-containing protein [Natribaculum luteum]